ncbi:hypothetical protein GE300_12230, partial [Rhodobacteraceae bacterium 2CG4]|nr:hypothetical protein [Halovulum marinum]
PRSTRSKPQPTEPSPEKMCERFWTLPGRPIIASTATTLSVFFPLLFWSGMVGEFMKFLPITVILTLFASLFMALIFIPVMGGLIGKRQPQTARAKAALHEAETGDPRRMGGFTGAYVRLLERAILRPGATLLLAVAMLLGAFGLYGQLGKGVSFFPSVEPDFMQVQVRARDNVSIYERDRLVRLRPVVLTSVTTALGLMPMVIGLNINFFTRDIVYGAPSTQWWTELSSAIAGGLVIATLLTLIVTPAMLMLGEKRQARQSTPRAPQPA